MNELNEIRGYIDSEGRLTQLPSKRRKKIIALVWLAERIPPDRYRTERDFNTVLDTLHTFGDPATLRRELFDYYLVDRDQDGSNYCVNPNRPSLEEFLEKYCQQG